MLWLCAIATPTCITGAYLFRENVSLSSILLLFGLLPILITCCGFIVFAIFKPEKLQSEDYQIRHESLQIIQQKGGRIVIPPTSIEAIANPARGYLTSSLDETEGEAE